MDKRRCAICGQEKKAKEFGDGITVPLTVCLSCHKKSMKKGKQNAKY